MTLASHLVLRLLHLDTEDQSTSPKDPEGHPGCQGCNPEDQDLAVVLACVPGEEPSSQTLEEHQVPVGNDDS